MFLSIGPRSRGRSRVRFHQIAGAALVFFVMLSLLRMARRSRSARSPQRSIYDYTEGQTAPRGGGGRGDHRRGDIVPEREMAEYLRDLVSRHGLTQNITFHARRIRPEFKPRQKRESMTVIRKKFGPLHGFTSLQVAPAADGEDDDRHELKRASQQHQQSLPPTTAAAAYIEPAVLTLPLPGPPELPDQVDATALLFGIATTYSRLVASNASLLHDWSRWLTDGRGRSNGAGLLLVLHRASASETGHVGAKLRELGIDATVRSSSSAAAGVGGSSPDGDGTWSYLELVGRLALHARNIFKEETGDTKKRGGQDRKYLGLVDDDVFFPSMHRLLARLGALDPAESAYVGLPSEQADWTTTEEGGNATMTYGGGAVFLTRPLAEAVSKMPCARQPQKVEQQTGVNEAPPGPQTAAEEAAAETGQWDERLYRCITAHHSSRLRIMPSLYTSDEEGGDGGYDSGLRPLALHHYRQRHQRFVPSRAHLVASLAGEGSFLQRFLFRGDGWVLVNGHSIAEYPDGVDLVPLSRVSNPKKPLSVLVTQQPHEILYNDKENVRDNSNGRGATNIRPASRIAIDSDAAQKQERKDQKVVSWTGVKRVWRHLDSRIVRDETGTVKEVWQAYVKHAGPTLEYDDGMLDPSDTVHRQDGVSDLNSVIVLIWESSS
ncbi:hypothetical protein PG985_004011 [Apiospora marii]|uniref:uncharacterized protein n=1 Tax=Apiospora marii TaxID=335849 RepID=UPI00312D871C